jgi:XTP/dITP diphosphohydrolase
MSVVKSILHPYLIDPALGVTGYEGHADMSDTQRRTQFYLASGNEHKAQELTELLIQEGLSAVEVCSAKGIGGMPKVDENEATFSGNARLKALALWRQAPTGSFILADDSGLEVDALGGRPGVHSARYAGSDATDEENRQKLLLEMAAVPPAKRTARFRCVLVLVDPDGNLHEFDGASEGMILTAQRGDCGFGYDPLFVPQGEQRSYAEMSMAEKNQTSHRSRALHKLAKWYLSR